MRIAAESRLFALALAATVALSSCGGGQGIGAAARDAAPLSSDAKPGVLAISASPRLEPFPTSSAQYEALKAEAEAIAYGAGARGQVLTFTWRELESAPGEFDPAKLALLRSAAASAQAGISNLYVGIQVINSYVKELPSDLAGLAFDDAVVRRRFRDLLGRIVGSNAGGIRYLSIGNEVDLYLGNHTPEIAAYTAFFQDAAQAARALDPAIQVGVTGTGAGALGAGQTLLRDLNDAASDVVILTYYPVEPDQAGNVSVRDPSVVSGDFQRLLAFAGTKPIVLQEAGFPASGDNGSSTALQAEFMRQLFVAWRAAGGRIPFLNIFLLHDLPSLVCDELLAYYGLSSSGSLKSALCSLGLRTVDGTPRPAWESVLDEARQAHLP